MNELANQRKVYEDNRTFLGVEKAHCLYYDLSKIDILLWKNIHDLGGSPELISESCKLDNFNLCFSGVSLFHYFAAQSEIIQAMFDMIDLESQGRELTRTEKTLPLQCINPDNDNKTALYLSIKGQSPKSFEIMIQGLEGFTDICITKMILKSFALLLRSDNPDVIKFFDSCLYIPPQMQIEQFVPWNDGDEQIVFTCHTSVISQKLLIQKLAENGVEV